MDIIYHALCFFFTLVSSFFFPFVISSLQYADCQTMANAVLMMDTERNDCYLSLLWLQNAHYCDLVQSKPGHLGENCFSVTFD